MKNLKYAIEVSVFILCFLLLFAIFQLILTPKYNNESSTMVDGFLSQPKNSVDVLFLGSSQMFCSVDSQLITEQTGISCYDLGASSQPLSLTYFYLTEALKTQTPRFVFVELCRIFNEPAYDDATLSWTFAPMKISAEKINAAFDYLGSDYTTAIKYSVFPILAYHSRWKELAPYDIRYYFEKHDYSARGFYSGQNVKQVSLNFLSVDDNPHAEIPEQNIDALNKIVNLCNKKDIRLIFFRAPCPNWRVSDYDTVREKIEDFHTDFLDLNNYYEEIGINPCEDFSDNNHLNIYGARKTSIFLANYLSDIFE